MLTPDEVRTKLRGKFERNYPNWALGDGTWPLHMSLRPPSTTERARDPVACHGWARDWSEYDGPGTVEYATLRFPTGKHSMPKSLILADPSEVAAAFTDTARTWRIAGERLGALTEAFPSARLSSIARRVTTMDDEDYNCLAGTTDWLRHNPTSGMFLRQLPIEGIGTKWLRRHAKLVLTLLGADAAAGEFDEDDTSDEDPNPSRTTRLHRRLGLRNAPELLQVAVLDSGLRATVGGMRHFAATTDDLNGWPHHPSTVVILENKETGYAFTDDMPGVVVLHGNGSNVAPYARIDWVHSADVLYWGDMDGPGLRFVSDLRERGVAARSVLMDLPTLRAFGHLAVAGAAPGNGVPGSLTAGERELYAHLLDHTHSTGTGLVLEQERIPWPHAQQTIADAIKQEHGSE